jgi:hypothetical protein
MNQLCPALNRDNWTPQEDATLVRQQRVYGNVWSRIAQDIPGRSPNAVKNRWSWLSRHAVSSALAMRMIPTLVQGRPPPLPIVLPELSRGAPLTAPPDLEWQVGSPVCADGPPRVAFSDPTDFGDAFNFGSALGDAEPTVELPERFGKDEDDPLPPFDDWGL